MNYHTGFHNSSTPERTKRPPAQGKIAHPGDGGNNDRCQEDTIVNEKAMNSWKLDKTLKLRAQAPH